MKALLKWAENDIPGDVRTLDWMRCQPIDLPRGIFEHMAEIRVFWLSSILDIDTIKQEVEDNNKSCC